MRNPLFSKRAKPAAGKPVKAKDFRASMALHKLVVAAYADGYAAHAAAWLREHIGEPGGMDKYAAERGLEPGRLRDAVGLMTSYAASKRAGRAPVLFFAVPLKSADHVAHSLVQAGMEDFDTHTDETDELTYFSFPTNNDLSVAHEVVRQAFHRQIQSGEGAWANWKQLEPAARAQHMARAKKAGAWGARSYDSDSVHDILDRHRPKASEGGKGFDEPVPPGRLPALLKELDALSGGVGDDLQHYLGVVVFLATHGSEVPRQHREMALMVADDLMADGEYLSAWRDPKERKAELEKESRMLRGGKVAEDIKVTLPATELVKHFESAPGYDSPEGKSLQQMEDYLKDIYGRYREWNDPAYGGGSFERMALKMAQDDFYKSHYVAKAYLKLKGEKWASAKRGAEELDGTVWSNGEDGLMYMEKRGTGYYGHCGRYDFEAASEAEARQKLEGWGFEFAGWDKDASGEDDSPFQEIDDPVCACGHTFQHHDRYCDLCGDSSESCNGFLPAPMEKQVAYLMERRSFGEEKRGRGWVVYSRGDSPDWRKGRWVKVHFDGERVGRVEGHAESRPGSSKADAEKANDVRQGWEGLFAFAQAYGD